MNSPRTLNKIPFEELYCGMRVRSQLMKSLGVIVGLNNYIDREDRTVDITWDNGNKLWSVWHNWLDRVEEVLDEIS